MARFRALACAGTVPNRSFRDRASTNQSAFDRRSALTGGFIDVRNEDDIRFEH